MEKKIRVPQPFPAGWGLRKENKTFIDLLRGSEINARDIEAFDEFIRGSDLFDLPIHGRCFMCYRPDNTCKSRIDRIMVNSRWLASWPNSFQMGLQRTLSDHVPIFLEIKVSDWGPKPFRFINAWLSHTDFADFVKSKWSNYAVLGGEALF